MFVYSYNFMYSSLILIFKLIFVNLTGQSGPGSNCKEYFPLSRTQKLEPQNQMQFSVIYRTPPFGDYFLSAGGLF